MNGHDLNNIYLGYKESIFHITFDELLSTLANTVVSDEWQNARVPTGEILAHWPLGCVVVIFN